MFFYKELSPLVIASNVANLQFTNIAVNASSSMTFTVSAASGEKTETVTLSDNTNQFEFSPSSFSLGEAGSQVVTVTFKPTASSVKTGVITANSSGGSSVSVSLTGSATLQTRIAVGTALAASASAGSKAPANPPNGSEGWYYTNSATGAANKADWFFWAAANSGAEVISVSASNVYGYFTVNFPTTGSINKAVTGNGPFINLYTTGSATSRLAFIPTGSVASYVTGSDLLFYMNVNPAAHPEIPANRRFKLGLSALSPSGTSLGTLAAGQNVNYMVVSTNSAATPLNSVQFTLRNMGVQFADRMEEIVCLKSGSV